MDFNDKVKRAKKGDEEAFLFLMNECKKKLYRTAYSYVKDESLALDIVQETVYKAYISIDKLKKVEYFTTWITRILINNALDVVKKNNKVVYLADKQFFENIEDKEKISSEEKICLWEAIDSLEEKHREVIVLKYFNDMTVTEIAEVLSYPVGTVKTYLNKGLVRLRKIVEKDVV
ncbi:MAG: sigma-70 family RNA polymerase sigma factor [Sarcina sp.]